MSKKPEKANPPAKRKGKTLAEGRKPGSGRPTKLTHELLESLDAHLDAKPKGEQYKRALDVGTPVDIACAAVGITRRTYELWRKQAEEGSGEESEHLQEFFAKSERIRAMSVVRHLGLISAIGKGTKKGNWLPLAWILDRTDQEHFALRPAQQITNIAIDAKDVVSQVDAAALAYQQRKETESKATDEGPTVDAEIVEEDGSDDRF